MKDRMILKDETIIELESGSSLDSIKVLFDDTSKIMEVYNKMTDENLSEVTIKVDEDTVVGIYKNLKLISETTTTLEDGTYLAEFNLRQKSDVEIKIAEVEAATEQNTKDLMQIRANIDYIAMETEVEL